MRSLLQILVASAVSVAIACGIAFIWPPAPAYNPDPNHTHADFAVWIGGSQLDFSAPEFMSGSSTDGSTHPTDGPRKYLHLHDGNGHVIHRHKPGLALIEFLQSLGVKTRTAQAGRMCITFPQTGAEECESEGQRLMIYINSVTQKKLLSDDYVFADGDRLLITDSVSAEDVWRQWGILTADACRYSKTCPWKGKPPTEGCIADPLVPCKL